MHSCKQTGKAKARDANGRPVSLYVLSLWLSIHLRFADPSGPNTPQWAPTLWSNMRRAKTPHKLLEATAISGVLHRSCRSIAVHLYFERNNIKFNLTLHPGSSRTLLFSKAILRCSKLTRNVGAVFDSVSTPHNESISHLAVAPAGDRRVRGQLKANRFKAPGRDVGLSWWWPL